MKHGTTTGYYSHGCRCDACKLAKSRHSKRWRLDRVRGVDRLVDAQPLRDHVELLRASGMSFRTIALACGWSSRNALADALTRSRVRPSTLARVLAVTALTDQRGDRYVDATGSRRRLQALAALGWSGQDMAGYLGRCDKQHVLNIMAGRNATVRGYMADDIRRMYDDLWDRQGSSERTRRWAAARGFCVPMAWDDDSIDNPAAVPHGQERVRRLGLRADDVEELLAMGETREAIAMRFGVTRAAVDQTLSRARAS